MIASWARMTPSQGQTGRSGKWSEWDTGTEASVAQVPEPGAEVEHAYRSRFGKQLPGQNKTEQGQTRT